MKLHDLINKYENLVEKYENYLHELYIDYPAPQYTQSDLFYEYSQKIEDYKEILNDLMETI